MSTPEPDYYNYIITNVRRGNLVTLRDPNYGSPLVAGIEGGNLREQWIVTRLSNQAYLIRNAEHKDCFANAEHGVQLKDVVGGRDDTQHWMIEETGTGGEYRISTIDTGLFWALEDRPVGTPIVLRPWRADPEFRWTFQKAITGAVAAEIEQIPSNMLYRWIIILIRAIFSIIWRHQLGLDVFNPNRLITGPLPSNQSDPKVARSDQNITGSASNSQPTPSQQHSVDFQPSEQPTFSGPVSVVNISLLISEAIDFRGPLNAMSEALKKVLKTAKSIDDPNEVWKWPTRRLLFHLDTIESQSVQLEEDFLIDKTTLSTGLTVIEPLEMYASELNNIYRLIRDDETQGALNREVIQQKIHDMDDSFEEYTTSLYNLPAQLFIQTKQKLPDVEQDFVEEAKLTHGIRQIEPNFYGVQHNVCVQGTRERTREAIRKWADNKSSDKPVFLLLDVAGSGKSTVAKAMNEEWKQKRLVARFFFSRDTKSTMSTASFCSTVADAFIAKDPSFKAPIEIFKQTPDFALLSFQDLFNGLVTGPLETLDRDAILIIDALDECENEDGSREDLLSVINSQKSAIPRLYILATGRPELDIKSWAHRSRVEYTNFIQLEGSNEDVEVYIKHRLQDLPLIKDQLYPVIKHADGLFICARIACDLILKTVDIDALLEELKEKVSLDYLYEAALDQSIPKDESSRRAFIVVLQMILASQEPLSIAELDFFSPKRGIVEQVITRMGALLLYKDREDPIRLLHATFREFLTAQSKAGIYFIQVETGHHTLASGCLDFIRHYSTQDDSTLQNLDRNSQRTYVYSSKSWVYHCIASRGKLALNKPILDFANRGLQSWAYLADKWYSLDTVSCLRDIHRLSHQHMSPGITEIMVDQSLKTIVGVVFNATLQ